MDNQVTDAHWPSNLTMAHLTEDEREESFGYATETSRKINPNLDYQRAAWWYEEAVSTFNKIYTATDNQDHVTAFFAAAQLQYSMRNDCEAAWPNTDFLGVWDYNDLGKLRARTRSIEQEAVSLIETKGVSIRHMSNAQDLYAGNPIRDWSALTDNRVG